MDFEVKREMVNSIDDEKLKELFERDAKQGKFWFRLYVNECANADELYLYLLGIGLLDFQAQRVCVDFGEHTNDKGEKIAEIIGMKEGEVMSFMVVVATEDELEEQVDFFAKGVRLMKEAVTHCLLHQIPGWVTESKRVTI